MLTRLNWNQLQSKQFYSSYHLYNGIVAKLYYITHPSVQIDKNVSPENWDISEKGRQEAQELLKQDFWPEVEVVFTSTEPKSRTVGSMVAEAFGLPVEAIKELGEADRTETPFLPLDEYMQAIQEAYRTPDTSVRGWESHHDMFVRNQEAVDKLLAKYPGRTIAIIGHGGAGTCVKCYLGNVRLDFSQDPQRTGCIFIADTNSHRLIRDWYPYC